MKEAIAKKCEQPPEDGKGKEMNVPPSGVASRKEHNLTDRLILAKGDSCQISNP